MYSVKFLRLLTTVSVAAASAVAPAFSHAGVVLPLSHAAKAAVSLKGLVHHSTFSLPGAGSTTVRINNQIIKSIISHGYANGQTFAINNSLGGAISGGNLSGSLYFPVSSTTYANYYGSTRFGLAVGNSSVNSGGIGFIIPAFPSNSLSFSNVGLAAVHGTKSLTPIYSAGFSGASRARTALYKSLARQSTAAGSKSITTLGPISGGQVYGAFGANAIGSSFYQNYITYAYAFGSNPLNTSTISTYNFSQFRNYLTFANGSTRTITGGQLVGTLYGLPSGGSPFSYGTYGLSFGNSPFNVNGAAYLRASLKNAIYLAALLKGK